MNKHKLARNKIRRNPNKNNNREFPKRISAISGLRPVGCEDSASSRKSKAAGARDDRPPTPPKPPPSRDDADDRNTGTR